MCSHSAWEGLAPELLQQVLSRAQHSRSTVRLVCKAWRDVQTSGVDSLQPRARAQPEQLRSMAAAFPAVQHLDLAQLSAAAEEQDAAMAEGLAELTDLRSLSLVGVRRVHSGRVVSAASRRLFKLLDASNDSSGCSLASTVCQVPRLLGLTQLSLVRCPGMVRLALPQLAGLPALRSLDLSGSTRNHWRDIIDLVPADLACLTHLTALTLAECDVLPRGCMAALAQLSALRQLSMQGSCLDPRDALPPAASSFGVLEHFAMPSTMAPVAEHDRLSGFVAAAMRCLVELICCCREQRIRSCVFYDEDEPRERAQPGTALGLPDLRRLTALRRLTLRCPEVTPVIAAALSQLSRGATLELQLDVWLPGSAALLQQAPHALAATTRLVVLAAIIDQLTALPDLLQLVAQLPQLADLQLLDGRHRHWLPDSAPGTALPLLADATGLTRLAIRGVADVAEVFGSLCCLPRLEHLAVTFTGSSLAGISRLARLRALSLLDTECRATELRGDALIELTSLTGLAELALSCHDISPASFAALARLTALTALQLADLAGRAQEQNRFADGLSCLTALQLLQKVDLTLPRFSQAACMRLVAALPLLVAVAPQSLWEAREAHMALVLDNLRSARIDRVVTYYRLAPDIPLDIPEGVDLALELEGKHAWPTEGLQELRQWRGAVTALTKVDLDCEHAAANLLAAAGQLPRLADLSLHDLQPRRLFPAPGMLGEVPAPQQLSTCTQLRRLSLAGSRYAGTGAVLRAICTLSRLEALDLTACEWVTDADLPAVSALSGLCTLCVAGCPLTGEALAALRPLRRLLELDLSGCPLTGETLTALRPLERLVELDVSGCRLLGGASLAPLGHLTRLTGLAMKGCPALVGKGDVAALSTLRALRCLYLPALGAPAALAAWGALVASLPALEEVQPSKLQAAAVAGAGTRRTRRSA